MLCRSGRGKPNGRASVQPKGGTSPQGGAPTSAGLRLQRGSLRAPVRRERRRGLRISPDARDAPRRDGFGRPVEEPGEPQGQLGAWRDFGPHRIGRGRPNGPAGNRRYQGRLGPHLYGEASAPPNWSSGNGRTPAEKDFGPEPEADRKGTPSGEPTASAGGLLKITRTGHLGAPHGIGAAARTLR